MKLIPAGGANAFAGVFMVDGERSADARGSFARAYCARSFVEQGLNTKWPQCNISSNARRGTLRGLHFQAEPYAEIKLIRCVHGAIFDAIVDLRRQSPSFGQWMGLELSAANNRALYVPAGFAHGFQSLSDDAVVFYQMSCDYAPQAARGYRYDDPSFAIEWPLPVTAVSERDLALPPFEVERC